METLYNHLIWHSEHLTSSDPDFSSSPRQEKHKTDAPLFLSFLFLSFLLLLLSASCSSWCFCGLFFFYSDQWAEYVETPPPAAPLIYLFILSFMNHEPGWSLLLFLSLKFLSLCGFDALHLPEISFYFLLWLSFSVTVFIFFSLIAPPGPS